MNEDFEFLISQYADGSLDAAERPLLEMRLATDASARALLEEYRRLDSVLAASSEKPAKMPEVAWDSLAARISGAVAAMEDQQSRPMRFPSWARTLAPIALAAGIAIATAVGIVWRLSSGHAPNSGVAISNVVKPAPAAVNLAQIDIAGPQAERASGPVEVSVAIGPPTDPNEPTVVRYSDELVSRPSHMTVASGMSLEHDAVTLPDDMQ